MQQMLFDADRLIPRELLFGNPDKTSVKLSPDGAKISYLAPLHGVLNVWVGPADDAGVAQPVTRDSGRGIRMYDWMYTNEHLLYVQDQKGDEDWHVYSVSLKSGEIIDLTPLEGVQARIQHVSPDFPNEIMIGLNDREPQLHDLYIVDVGTGERRLLLENEGFAGFVADDAYDVRFGLRFMPDGGTELLKYADVKTWEPFLTVGMDDSLTTMPMGFDKSGQILYMFDSRDRNTAALVTFDLGTGKQTVLFEDPQSDVSGLLVHPTEKTVQAVASTYERKRWEILDGAIADDLEYLKTVADGDVEVGSRTLDDKYWVVSYLLDDGPVKYYRYDRVAQNATFLFTHRKDLEDVTLVKMHPVVIQSRDGLNLVSYYTLPLLSSPQGAARPDRPLPMVLLVHGGPWGRDTWGYHPVHQLLADRGYAVLSVNFRVFYRIWQGVHQRRELRVGRQDARRSAGRHELGHRAGHRRS